MKTLNWRELVAYAIPHSSFAGSRVLLRKLRDDEEYAIFICRSDKLYEATFTLSSRISVDRIDTIDSNLPIRLDESIHGEDWPSENRYKVNWVVVPKSVFQSNQTQTQPTRNQNQSGETTMAVTLPQARRTVRIELIDNDAGLDVQHALVAAYDNIMTEDDDATTIQELIMNRDIARKLREHNAIREAQVDLDILKNTGNSVNLRPVKLKDLTWIVK